MNKNSKNKPLADRIRPRSLDEFFGQEKIIGSGKMLRRAIEEEKLPSLIFWGPPGTGKTTLAFIISQKIKADFVQISAVSAGKKDLMSLAQSAKEKISRGEKTVLFIDEIHRWNKVQQDALLGFVESGDIILIGATTENPSFEVRPALLSRTRVFVLEKLSIEDIEKIIKRALTDKQNGLGERNIEIDEKAKKALAEFARGDARKALNILEYASSLNKKIDLDTLKEAFQKSHLLYDGAGDEYYNLISALHKSMRGSDAGASLYYLARMLEAGEDPLKIARRVIRFASEDIGLANSRALEQAVSAYNACRFVGMPECELNLAQAVVYMAKCKKSNSLYRAYGKVKKDIEKYGNLEVPKHIRNAPTSLMKNLGYGKNYKYSPDFDYKENQDYLPEELRGKRYLE